MPDFPFPGWTMHSCRSRIRVVVKKTAKRVRERGKRIAQGKDYEIFASQRGSFEIVRLHGKCTPAMLNKVRDRLLSQTLNIAIDAAGLTDANVPLVRELDLSSRRLRNTGNHLVLMNARGPLRDLIRARTQEGSIPTIVSESILEGDISGFRKRLADSRRKVSLIHADLQADASWQIVDREQCWMCPYCGLFQDFLKLDPKKGIHDVQAEMVYLHLTHACSPYKAGKTIQKLSELLEKLRKKNLEKLSASTTTTTALASRIVEMQGKVKEAEELEAAVQIAAHRQRHLLPADVPEIPGMVAGLGYWPFHRVSGDFFDFIDLGNGRLGILIGDVSGHGIEAAVLMGVAKKVINIRLRDSGDPLIALQMANRDIYPDLDRMTFVSAFLGIYEAETRGFEYVRAGHNPVILFNPDRNPAFSKLEPPGLVLGLDSGARFNHLLTRESVTLQDGDRLLLYTDGIVEAQNADGEEFELQRVYELLRAHPGDSPREFLDLLDRQVTDFQGGVPQEDDQTAIFLRCV